ncbi:hypothetical protein ACFLSQ_04820 [Bacteroidota bacterium]
MSEKNPLFLIEAEQLIQSGLFDESVALCIKGLEDYPEYTTAHVILALAYEQKGEINNALNTVNAAINDFPDSITLINVLNRLPDEIFEDVSPESIGSTEDIGADIFENGVETDENENEVTKQELFDEQLCRYDEVENSFSLPGGFLRKYITSAEDRTKISEIHGLPKIENIKYKNRKDLTKERSSYRKTLFIPDIPISGIEEPIKEEFLNDKTTLTEEAKMPSEFESNIEKLAKKLEEVSFHNNNSGGIPPSDSERISPGIISETMANIYIAQGAYEEAVMAYKQLLILNPDKEEYYSEKIQSIESKMK